MMFPRIERPVEPYRSPVRMSITPNPKNNNTTNPHTLIWGCGFVPVFSRRCSQVVWRLCASIFASGRLSSKITVAQPELIAKLANSLNLAWLPIQARFLNLLCPSLAQNKKLEKSFVATPISLLHILCQIIFTNPRFSDWTSVQKPSGSLNF